MGRGLSDQQKDILRAALAAKTTDRLVLVSDAMATIGSAQNSITLFGEAIAVRDGALRTEAGTLAGAHLELSGAVRNAMSMLHVSHEDALRMASATPANFMKVGHERGRIKAGYRADMVLLDSGMNAKATWIGGRQVH